MRPCRLEDCRIITSFYLTLLAMSYHGIGRLPYYYFLLLRQNGRRFLKDWKTAVLLLPFTKEGKASEARRLEDCRIITSFYFFLHAYGETEDWKTAVLLLPFTSERRAVAESGLEDCRIITSFYLLAFDTSFGMIGRLPYYYFLLLGVTLRLTNARLEDCRIITSFY